MPEKDYSLCDVCGLAQDVDPLHILIDNGRVARHTYAHRRHRYVEVQVGSNWITEKRTDLEVEALAHKFRMKELEVGWE